MSWSASRVGAAAGAALLVLVGLVVLGRWERQRQVDSQIRGMDRIRALVGPLDQPSLSAYRVLPGFDCLLYDRRGNPYALELCVDRAGRVVEAFDRRAAQRHVYSLRYE